jgi:hypothetical protein
MGNEHEAVSMPLGPHVAMAAIVAANPPESTQATPQASEPTATTKRGRRTKAEMAADAILEKTGHAPVNGTSSEPEPSELPPVTTRTQVVSADELRSLLNGYIAKHSMEDAIGKLKAFNCNRVTEALSLPVDQLSQLAEALRG